MTAAAVPERHRRWTDERPPEAPRSLAGSATNSPRHWKPFLIGLAAALVFLAWIVAVVDFHVAGAGVAKLMEGADKGLAALAAAASCGFLARRTTGKIRLGWALIAASAFITFGAGAAVLAGYEVLGHRPVPFPSIADAFYIFGAGLAITGILALPSSPTRTGSRGRLTIDGAVIAVSLLYIAWALGLGSLYHSSGAPLQTEIIGLAYPIVDIVAVTVLVLTIRRASRAKAGRLGILLAGLVMKSVADGAFAVLSVHAGQVAITRGGDILWMSGYLLVALAALWPVHPVSTAAQDGPTSLWQMVTPWLGMLGVILTSLALDVTGHAIDSFVVYPAVALGFLLMASQLLSYRDSLSFLNKSRQAEAALGERTHLLNQVIAHAPLGVARVSVQSRFLDVNPRLGALLHASSQIMIGAHLSEFMDGTEAPERIARYQQLYDGEIDTIEEESEVKRADGSQAWLHWNTTAVRKTDGSFDYYLAMAEDITGRHEQEETAMANLAGLERLNKLKSEFVSMVSHEFRTALVGIQGFSELILDETLDQKDTQELAGDINKEALRLNRMIGEMLDLDRIEAGKIRLDLRPVNLSKLVNDAVDRARVSGGGHTLETDLDLSLPLISGDSDRLIQVISNLLSNAVKYSPEGGVITVASHLDHGAVDVSVQDRGLGIPPEFIGRLFGRYERFESDRPGSVVGTGLGLAISRQIVELHGGRIWVDSKLGEGSTFHFTIPAPGRAAAGVPDGVAAIRAA